MTKQDNIILYVKHQVNLAKESEPEENIEFIDTITLSLWNTLKKRELNGDFNKLSTLRSTIIFYFTTFIADKFDVSYRHAQSSIVKSVSKDELAKFTSFLMNTLLDELRDISLKGATND